MKQLSASIFVILTGMALCLSCHPESRTTEVIGNPAMPGFDSVGSDPAAIELADSIMQAMGGRAAWDNTRYLQWNFFGRRDLTWDKHTGWVRIESPGDSATYIVNIHTGEGKVKIKGEEINESDTLAKLLDRAKSIWINDSYWLVMPFKLKDSGVTLKYMGEDTLADGKYYNILQLTFNDVGNTPQNKYHLFVDIQEKLIKQWSFYQQADDDTARFTRPWDNYQKYGNILLSADRSDGGGPAKVKVLEKLPDNFFTDF